MKMLMLGAGNMVQADRIVCIVSPDTSPIKRLVQDAKDEGRVIDVSCGKKTKSVIITDSEHIILSAIQPETVSNRIAGDETDDGEEDDDDGELITVAENPGVLDLSQKMP